MAYVPVPKDLTRIKTKVMFNLTKRQLVCFGGGALIGVPLFFLLREPVGVSAAALIMVLAMLPAFLLAMYERNGQPLEVVLGNMARVLFLRPKQRPYQTNNFYAALERQALLDKEVYRIVNSKKADPRREKADQGRHRKSEQDGEETEIGAGQHPLPADVAGRHLPGDGQPLHQDRPVPGHQLPAQPERGQNCHL